MTFSGNTLRRLRKSRGYTQRALGELIGVHHSHISKWEVEEYAPDGDNLQRLAQVFHVPASEFFMEARYSDYYPAERTEQDAVHYNEGRDSRLHYLNAVRHYLNLQLSMVNDEIRLLEREP